MAWVYLIMAGAFEVAFTTCLKLANNFTNHVFTAAFVVCAVISFALLNRAISTEIPLGTAYAVWTGIGAAGTAVVGITFFQESHDFLRILFIVMLIGSIAGLKFVSPH